MNRKEFFVLTFTLIGAAATGAAACSSSSTNNPDGATGTGGAGGAGNPGACTDPLPETQETDTTGHTHTVTVPAATLSATTDQTFTTSTVQGHMHMITIAVAQLATLKGGSPVTGVMSTAAGTPAHTHMFDISCT